MTKRSCQDTPPPDEIIWFIPCGELNLGSLSDRKLSKGIPDLLLSDLRSDTDYMGLEVKKPVVWVSDQVMLKQSYTATETS